MKKPSLIRVLVISLVTTFIISVAGTTWLVISSKKLLSTCEVFHFIFIGSLSISFFLVALAFGMISWFGMLVHSLVMVRQRKPDVTFFDARLMFNVFNVILLPMYLTNEGLESRRKVIRYFLIFIGSMVTGFICGHLFKNSI